MMNQQHLKFYVVKTANMSLLSLDACLDLGLLTVNRERVNVITDSQNNGLHNILTQHANVFEGVGCLPGEYRIE